MRWILYAITLILLVIIGNLVLSHNYKPKFEKTEGQWLNTDVWSQLLFIESQINAGKAEQMQAHYPEGYVFSISLYALAHIELLKKHKASSSFFNHSVNEIEKSISLLKSDKAKSIFQKELPIQYGAFYNGWLNYTISQYQLALPDSLQNTQLINGLKYFNQKIRYALNNSNTPYLESYAAMSWPADMCVCMAAYKATLTLQKQENDTTLNKWIIDAKSLVDQRNLIPNMVNSQNGSAIHTSMGSSQSLQLYLMHQIDSVWGAQMLKMYKEHFLIKRFGLPAISEFAKGENGNSHIDSGPVIWGVGAAASIVGVMALNAYGENKTAKQIRNSVNAFAFAQGNKNKRTYMFGNWLIADVFMAWVNASENCPENAF